MTTNLFFRNALMTLTVLCATSANVQANTATAITPSFENALVQANEALPAGHEWVALVDEKNSTAVLVQMETSELETALSAAADGDPIPFGRLKAMFFHVHSYSAGTIGIQGGLRYGRSFEIGLEFNYFGDWGLRAPGVKYEDNETVSVLSKREGGKYAAFAQIRLRTDGHDNEGNGINLKVRVLHMNYALDTFAHNRENGDDAPVSHQRVRGFAAGIGAGRYWASGFGIETGVDFRLKANVADGLGASTKGVFPNLSVIIPFPGRL